MCSAPDKGIRSLFTLRQLDPRSRTPVPENIVPASRRNFNFGTSTGDFASFILGPAINRGCGVTTCINLLFALPQLGPGLCRLPKVVDNGYESLSTA